MKFRTEAPRGWETPTQRARPGPTPEPVGVAGAKLSLWNVLGILGGRWPGAQSSGLWDPAAEDPKCLK